MSSARGLAERLYIAGRIAKTKQNKDCRKLPSMHCEAADMIMKLVCTVHRERRLRVIWQTLAYMAGSALAALVGLLSAGLSA